MIKNLPSSAGDMGSSAGQGTKNPHAAGWGQKKREREEKEEWNRAWIGSRTVTSN